MGIDGGGEHRDVIVVRGERHRHHTSTLLPYRFQYCGRLWMQRMHALQSFDFPVYAGALLVCDKDVQKPFGEMADSARGLHVHLAEVGGHCESVKQRE